MAVARQYQQPRSIVLGRVPLPDEPLWLPDDLEWALAYEGYLASICNRCGTRHADWRKPDGRPDPDAYVAVPTRCPGAEALAIADNDIPENERQRGAYSVLVRGDAYDWHTEFKDAAGRLGLPRPKPLVI